MRYSFNMDKEPFVFAQRHGMNVSYKALTNVCNAVRYLRAEDALKVLEAIVEMRMPIEFKVHSKHRGARHELGGKKGGYPVKAAKEVRIVILNAIANAKNKGMSGEEMYIIHASANKTEILRRYPSKGSMFWGRGMYRSHINRSDLEHSKLEIGLANGDEKELTKNMKYFIKTRNKPREIKSTPKKAPAKPLVKPKKEEKPKEKEVAKATA